MKKLRPEISLFRGNQQRSRAVLSGRSLCVGKSWKCDLTDPHSEMEKLVLLRKTPGGYQLRLPPGSTGRFSKAGSTLDLDHLLAWGFARRRSGWYIISLDSEMSGEFSLHGASCHLAFTDRSPLLKVSEAPVSGVLPLKYRFGFPDKNDIFFTIILMTILVLQVVMVRRLGNYPIPEITNIRELPRRISRLILEPVAPPAPVRVVKPAGPDSTAETVGPEDKPPAVEEVPSPEESPVTPAQAKEPTPGVGRESLRSQVSKVGVLGVLTGKGTAGRRSRSNPVSALQLDQDLQRDLDQVLGNVKDISITDTGPGNGSGSGEADGSGTGLMEIDGVLEGEGIGDQIRVSRIDGSSDISAHPEAASADPEVQEVVRPEQRIERSSRMISRVVASHTGAIRYAYNRELRKNPALRGKIVLTFTISAEGSVTECKVEESEMDWPPLEDSLVRMVRGWKFPEIPEGSVTVSYPLVFFPSM